MEQPPILARMQQLRQPLERIRQIPCDNDEGPREAAQSHAAAALKAENRSLRHNASKAGKAMVQRQRDGRRSCGSAAGREEGHHTSLTLKRKVAGTKTEVDQLKREAEKPAETRRRHTASC